MSFTVVIPARYASTRLPKKPLVDIAGKSMVRRVFEQATQSAATNVVIATDHEEIYQHARAFTDSVLLTDVNHPSGTDRLQEVTKQLSLPHDNIVVNVQGDEPLLPAQAINQVAQNLIDNAWSDCATLCERITDPQEVFNPNAVKVVKNHSGLALYFSRAPIPWDREHWPLPGIRSEPKMTMATDYFRHIGLYAYRVGTLHKYVLWQQSALEQCEKLEQLRLLENGLKIHIAESSIKIPAGVDTIEDLERMRKNFI